MPHSMFDPVMRDLDRYLSACDEAEADTAAEDFESVVDMAQHYLNRAMKAWEDGDRAAAVDLLQSAATVLHDAQDIDTTTAADAPQERDL